MGPGKTDESGFEETLSEDQLLARIDTALEWGWRAGKLGAKSEREKSTPAKVAIWEQLVEYFGYIELVSDMILRIKLADRLASLTSTEKEELLQVWASLPLDSYEGRKLGKCSGFISRDQAVSTVREIRAKLKSKHEVFCTAARAFGIAEGDECWPGFGPLACRPNQPKKKRARASLDATTPLRHWIAEILLSSKINASALVVAKKMKVSDPRMEDQYRGDGKDPERTLEKVLRADRTLKKHFETLVSDVRSLIKTKGN